MAKALKAAPISRKLEIAQKAKSCSKQKKFLEIRKVARKLPSNLWQALVEMRCYIGHAEVASIFKLLRTMLKVEVEADSSAVT